MKNLERFHVLIRQFKGILKNNHNRNKYVISLVYKDEEYLKFVQIFLACITILYTVSSTNNTPFIKNLLLENHEHVIQ